MDFIRETIALLRLFLQCMSVAEIARRWAELGEFLCAAFNWQEEKR